MSNLSSDAIVSNIFQHHTSWSIIVSLQKHQHLVFGEMPWLPIFFKDLDKLQRIRGNSFTIIEQAFLHNGRKPTIRLNIISQCLCVHGLITTST
jgi:hypothetical protein